MGKDKEGRGIGQKGHMERERRKGIAGITKQNQAEEGDSTKTHFVKKVP